MTLNCLSRKTDGRPDRRTNTTHYILPYDTHVDQNLCTMDIIIIIRYFVERTVPILLGCVFTRLSQFQHRSVDNFLFVQHLSAPCPWWRCPCCPTCLAGVVLHTIKGIKELIMKSWCTCESVCGLVTCYDKTRDRKWEMLCRNRRWC